MSKSQEKDKGSFHVLPKFPPKFRLGQILVLILLLLFGAVAIDAGVTPKGVKVGTIIKDCEECPEMVAVPELGHSADSPGKIFYAGRYEITWKQYISAIEAGVCPVMQISQSRPKPWPPLSSCHIINDNYPITLVSPKEFQCFIKWIKEKTGNNYRVPSAIEWEHLARAGTNTQYPWGNELGFDHAAVRNLPPENDDRHYDVKRLAERYHTDRMAGIALSDVRRSLQSDDVWPVGSFEPNGWGIYDVIGNVEEVTTEISKECEYRNNKDKPCTYISTRGVGYLPRINYRIGSFSLITFRGVTTLNNSSGVVGFRIIRN